MVPTTVIAAIGLGDAAPVTSAIALRGIGLRPPPPVHGCCQTLANGDLELRWVRRARGGWQWQDGVETLLGEQAESYEVTFGPLAAPVARWETGSPVLTVTAALMTSLLAITPTGSFAIRHRGDRAVSEPLAIALS